MPTDFRVGKTFPRRGREALGGFLWLARVFDKARASASRTQDGYIYPCPMDRAMMHRWGINTSEFTTAIGERSTDDQILVWLTEHSSPDRMLEANEWLLRQTFALDRQDAEEGVAGAVAPKLPRGVIIGIAVAIVALLVSLLVRILHT